MVDGKCSLVSWVVVDVYVLWVGVNLGGLGDLVGDVCDAIVRDVEDVFKDAAGENEKMMFVWDESL